MDSKRAHSAPPSEGIESIHVVRVTKMKMKLKKLGAFFFKIALKFCLLVFLFEDSLAHMLFSLGANVCTNTHRSSLSDTSYINSHCLFLETTCSFSRSSPRDSITHSPARWSRRLKNFVSSFINTAIADKTHSFIGVPGGVL